MTPLRDVSVTTSVRYADVQKQRLLVECSTDRISAPVQQRTTYKLVDCPHEPDELTHDVH